MASGSIIAQLGILRQPEQCRARRNLSELASEPGRLPEFVRQSPAAMRYLELPGPLTWNQLPERDLTLGWPVQPVPYAAFIPACLIKLDQRLSTMGALRRYLTEEPALVWLCGFGLAPSREFGASMPMPVCQRRSISAGCCAAARRRKLRRFIVSPHLSGWRHGSQDPRASGRAPRFTETPRI
jgi:hypothetical protein